MKKSPNVKIHEDYRRDFTNRLRKPDHSMGINNESESSKSSATLCSAGKKFFDWKSNCFLCGKRLTVEKKQADRNKTTFKAGEIEFTDTIKNKI